MNTVVIGAGLAGLTAALTIRQAGGEVTLVTKGIGGLQLGQGTIDVLGYSPDRVTNPAEALDALISAEPTHPYAKIGAEAVADGLSFVKDAMTGLLEGEMTSNYQLPTAVGAVRPTALAPTTMVAGSCVDGARFVIAGPVQLKDFYPKLIAENLSRTVLPDGGRLEAVPASFSLPARVGEADSSALNYARALDRPEYRATFIDAVRPLVRSGYAIGLPAFLGHREPGVFDEIQSALGVPVFEIPLPPPGVPGMRMPEALTNLAKKARVRIMMSAEVTGGVVEDGRLTGVTVDSAGQERLVPADAVVLAAGGFESGALHLDSYGLASERIFNLPLQGTDIPEPTHGDYWGDPQPVFRIGVAVDEDMRPVDAAGSPVYPNLYAAGGIIGGALRFTEKSGEGIALGSALKAARAITGGK